jgi:hypothetical protein
MAYNVYALILVLIPEMLLVALAVVSGIGYIWRGYRAPTVPAPGWVLFVRAIILLILVAPFYFIISYGDIPLTQARAMSRVGYLSLFLSQIIGHVQVAVMVKCGNNR